MGGTTSSFEAIAESKAAQPLSTRNPHPPAPRLGETQVAETPTRNPHLESVSNEPAAQAWQRRRDQQDSDRKTRARQEKERQEKERQEKERQENQRLDSATRQAEQAAQAQQALAQQAARTQQAQQAQAEQAGRLESEMHHLQTRATSPTPQSAQPAPVQPAQAQPTQAQAQASTPLSAEERAGTTKLVHTMTGHGNPSDLIDILVTHKREFPDQFDAYYTDLLAQYKAALPENQQDEFHRFKALADRRLGMNKPTPQAAEVQQAAEVPAPAAEEATPVPNTETASTDEKDTTTAKSPVPDAPPPFTAKPDPHSGKTYALDSKTGEMLRTVDGDPILIGDGTVTPTREDLAALQERDRLLGTLIDDLQRGEPMTAQDIADYKELVREMYPDAHGIIAVADYALAVQDKPEHRDQGIDLLREEYDRTKDITFHSKLRESKAFVQSLEDGHRGGKNGYAQDRGAAIEAVNKLSQELLEKHAALYRLNSHPHRPGREVKPETIQRDIDRLKQELTEAMAEVTPFIEAPHPDVAVLLGNQFGAAETAGARRRDAIVTTALLLTSFGLPEAALGLAAKGAVRLGTSAGRAERIAARLTTAIGHTANAASVADAWHRAKRDTLSQVLSGANIDMRDPVQVHALLSKNPDLAREITNASVKAALTAIVGIKAGEKVGKKVDEMSGGKYGKYFEHPTASAVEEVGSSIVNDD